MGRPKGKSKGPATADEGTISESVGVDGTVPSVIANGGVTKKDKKDKKKAHPPKADTKAESGSVVNGNAKVAVDASPSSAGDKTGADGKKSHGVKAGKKGAAAQPAPSAAPSGKGGDGPKASGAPSAFAVVASSYVAGSILSSLVASANVKGTSDTALSSAFVDTRPKEIVVSKAVIVAKPERPAKKTLDAYDQSDEDTEDDDPETGISKRLSHGNKRKADDGEVEKEILHSKRARRDMEASIAAAAEDAQNVHPLTKQKGRDLRDIEKEDIEEEMKDAAARAGKKKPLKEKKGAVAAQKGSGGSGASGDLGAAAGGEVGAVDAKEERAHRDSKEDDPERLQRTIFVGNLPVDTAKHPKAFKKLAATYGPVESVRFRSVALKSPGSTVNRKAGLLGGKLHPDRDSINGYVVFETKEAATAALAMNGSVFNEKHLRVDNAGTPRVPDTTKSVFVGNLPFNAEDEQLYRLFSTCGRVTSVRVIRDSATNIGKGFGYVEFEDKGAVALALTMHGTKDETIGRELRVFRARRDAATHTKFRGEVAKKGTAAAIQRRLKTKKPPAVAAKKAAQGAAPKKVKSGGVTKKKTKVRSMDKAGRDRLGASKLAARAGKKSPKGQK
eukprot:Opistho-2@46572